MAKAARENDGIFGITSGEHSGHEKAHGPLQLTGEISGGSRNVFINGRGAATVGCTTIEHDGCCGTSSGSLGEGSTTVFINGKPAARQGDVVNVHNGNGIINSGSPNVFIGG